MNSLDNFDIESRFVGYLLVDALPAAIGDDNGEGKGEGRREGRRRRRHHLSLGESMLWVVWPSFLPCLVSSFPLFSSDLSSCCGHLSLLFLFDDDIPCVHPPITTAPIAKPKSWPIVMTHHHLPPTMETLQHCHMNFSVDFPASSFRLMMMRQSTSMMTTTQAIQVVALPPLHVTS